MNAVATIHSVRYLTHVFVVCVCAVLLGVVGFSTPAHAQSSIPGGIQGNISMNPEFPGPIETVTLVVDGAGMNESLALITWTLNGQVVQQGYGATKYRFQTDTVGTYYQISVTLQDPRGQVTRLEDSFIVADVAVAWEGKTYTPPFYKGRKLQTSASEVVLYALPHVTDKNGILYDPSVLVYNWSLKGVYRTSYGGRGDSTMVLRSSNEYQALELVLTVTDPLGEVRAREKVKVPLVEPRLRLYAEHPLMGIQYSKAILRDYNMPSNEGTLIAEPYFISAENRVDPNLTYEWLVGKDERTTPGRVVLTVEGEGAGDARVQLIVANTLVRQQNTRIDLNVSFGSLGTGPASQSTTAL